MWKKWSNLPVSENTIVNNILATNGYNFRYADSDNSVDNELFEIDSDCSDSSDFVDKFRVFKTHIYWPYTRPNYYKPLILQNVRYKMNVVCVW